MTSSDRVSVRARAARLVLAAGVRPVRRPRLPRRTRRLLAAALVVCAAAASVRPLHAQFFDPAAVAVAQQMGALVAETIALKRLVENQRDQARAHVLGKLAPLTGRLTTIFDSVDRSMAFVYSPYLNPPASPDPIPTRPVNQVVRPCAAGASWNVDDPDQAFCLEPVLAETTIDRVHARLDAEYGAAAEALYGTTRISVDPATRVVTVQQTNAAQLPAHVVELRAAHEEAVRARGRLLRESDEANVEETAGRRAALAGAYKILEEWRGCENVTPGSPAGGALPPCMTTPDGASPAGLGETFDVPDGGGGTVPVTGTEGMLQHVREQLRFVTERMPDEDASHTQMQTMLTQIAVMQGRLRAAQLELTAAAVESAEQSRVRAEAAQRRYQERAVHAIDCVHGEGVFGGVAASPFNVYLPDETGSGGNGRCIPVADDTDQVLQAMMNSDRVFATFTP